MWIDIKNWENLYEINEYGRKEYKPVKVILSSGEIKIYNVANDLAIETGVTKKSKNFLGHVIKDIEYI